MDKIFVVLAIGDENWPGLYLADCGPTLDLILCVHGLPSTFMRNQRRCGTIPHVPFGPLAAIAS